MGYHVELSCATIFTLLCIVLAFFYRKLRWTHGYFEKLGIPGPTPRMLVGTWGGASSKFLGDADIANSKQYGRLVGTYDGTTPNLLVTDPALIKQILRTSSSKFASSRVLAVKDEVLRSALLSSCGEDLQLQSLLSSFITKDKMKQIFPRVEASVETLIRNIQKTEESGQFDLTTLVSEFTYDLIAFTIFGIDLNADIDFKNEFVSFAKQLLTIKNSNSCFALIPYLFESGDSWIIPKKALSFFTNLVQTGIKETPRGSVFVEGKAINLIGLLVQASEEEKKLSVKDKSKEEENTLVLTDNLIVAKCLSTLLSFIACSRTTIVSSVYALLKNPKIEETLLKELETRPSKEKITYDELQTFPYLDKVLSEVLRVYPFEFRINKVCTEIITLDKYTLERGVRVSIPLYALYNDEEFYPNPKEFDPERFSSENSDKRVRETYLPFGQAGLDSFDIGLQLAFLAAKLAVLRLTEKVKFAKPDELELVLFKNGITGIPTPNVFQLSASKRS